MTQQTSVALFDSGGAFDVTKISGGEKTRVIASCSIFKW